jgi:hypothetical protein
MDLFPLVEAYPFHQDFYFLVELAVVLELCYD